MVELKVLPRWEDARGSLVAVEKIPFDVKRVFWVYDMDTWRGGHAHETCKQMLIAVHGRVLVKAGEWAGWLSDPHMGLYVPPGNMIDFYGPSAVLLVLCSDYYSNDYVPRKGTRNMEEVCTCAS